MSDEPQRLEPQRLVRPLLADSPDPDDIPDTPSGPETRARTNRLGRRPGHPFDHAVEAVCLSSIIEKHARTYGSKIRTSILVLYGHEYGWKVVQDPGGPLRYMDPHSGTPPTLPPWYGEVASALFYLFYGHGEVFEFTGVGRYLRSDRWREEQLDLVFYEIFDYLMRTYYPRVYERIQKGFEEFGLRTKWKNILTTRRQMTKYWDLDEERYNRKVLDSSRKKL